MDRGKFPEFLLLIFFFECLLAGGLVRVYPDAYGLRVVSVGTGVGADFGSIQAAVNAAEVGDVINVSAGVYFENVIVNKSVSLVGEDRETTIIDGGGNGSVVFVDADNVTVCGFTLRNSGNGDLNPFSGIRLYYSDNCSISDNVFVDNEYGVWFDCSCNNTFADNVVANNSGTYGIRFYESKNNTLSGNCVVGNGYGVYLYAYSDDNVVVGNNVSGNGIGVYIAHSEGNIVNGNSVVDSGLYSVALRLAGGNSVFHNNFVDDYLSVDVSDASVNSWDDGYPSGGNYWSGFSRVDGFCGVGQNVSGSDALNDTAFVLNGDNVDRYPLMGLFRAFDAELGGSVYSVETVCGSSVDGFELVRFETHVEVRLNVSDGEGSPGFCRVSVPTVFAEGLEGGYVVVVNGDSSVLFSVLESYGEFDVLYFAYVHHPFVPEFSSVLLVLFAVGFVALFVWLLEAGGTHVLSNRVHG